MKMLLTTLLATLTLGAATPAPYREKIVYWSSRSGFVELRRFVSVARSGQYEAGYNGKQGCRATGVLPNAKNALLWSEAQALITPGRTAGTPVPHASRKPHSSFGGRTAMDNGPSRQTLSLESGAESWTILDTRNHGVQHMIIELRQLLPPCAM